MMGSLVDRGNQYIQLVKVLYCKLPTIDKQLPTFPHRVWRLNCQRECFTTEAPWPLQSVDSDVKPGADPAFM